MQLYGRKVDHKEGVSNANQERVSFQTGSSNSPAPTLKWAPRLLLIIEQKMLPFYRIHIDQHQMVHNFRQRASMKSALLIPIQTIWQMVIRQPLSWPSSPWLTLVKDKEAGPVPKGEYIIEMPASPRDRQSTPSPWHVQLYWEDEVCLHQQKQQKPRPAMLQRTL